MTGSRRSRFGGAGRGDRRRASSGARPGGGRARPSRGASARPSRGSQPSRGPQPSRGAANARPSRGGTGAWPQRSGPPGALTRGRRAALGRFRGGDADGGNRRRAEARANAPVQRERGSEHPHDFSRTLSRQNWESLGPAILRVSKDPESTIARLKQFAALLLEWNGGVSNLISRNDVDRIVDRHISESVDPAHWLAASGARTWLDLGSGGGFPAIPLALLGVGSDWTLVESRRNKTLFLTKCIQVLNLSHVHVVRDRIENLPDPDPANRFDAFTSRATLPLEDTLDQAARFVRPGGAAFLWKGSRREQEMESGRRWKDLWDLDGLLGVGSAGTVVARFIRK